jgi:O-antigen ligase
MAEMMVVAVPFLGAIYLAALQRGGSMQKRSGLLTILLGALAVLVVGILVNRSLAGIGLLVPTVAATIALVLFRNRRAPAWAGLLVLALLAGSVSLVLSSQFGNNLTTEEARSSTSSRYTSFSTTATAAKDYAPLGSGVGTFPQIYPSYENPQQVDRWYMNHAHNDYLELALETGIPGILLILAFVAWWGWRVAMIWGADEADHFARAATIATAVTLAHSAVEFPLRTAAISAVFAMCCALMADPRQLTRRRKTGGADPAKAKHLSAD